MNIHYLWWPLSVVILYGMHAYFSFFNKGAEGWKPFLTVWGLGILVSPLWPIISRLSKNLMFDALIFDLLLLITYTFIFFILERHHETFRSINYIGYGLILLGIILIKK